MADTATDALPTEARQTLPHGKGILNRSSASAAVLVLSNDPSYWKGRKSAGASDAAFELREGRTVMGMLDWADHTGPGTKRGREVSITLKGGYPMIWRDYSRIGGRFGEFRFLYIPVASG